MVDYLRERPEGTSLVHLEDELRSQGITLDPGMAEAVLMLSKQVREKNGCWYRAVSSQEEIVCEALEVYSITQNKSLFKVDKALEGMASEFRPTVEDLEKILNQSEQFELLKNNMVRRLK